MLDVPTLEALRSLAIIAGDKIEKEKQVVIFCGGNPRAIRKYVDDLVLKVEAEISEAVKAAQPETPAAPPPEPQKKE